MSKGLKKKSEKRVLVAMFGGGCQVCGYNTSMRALQFHHLDSTEKKDFSGGRGSASYDEVRAHPERFQLLCANHHFEAHDAIDRANRVYRNCDVCQKRYWFHPSRLLAGKDKHCSKKCASIGLSRMHQGRAWDRFLSRVEKRHDGCWVWTGAVIRGYPVYNVSPEFKKYTQVSAVRYAYENLNGKLADIKVRVYRQCKTPLCVNPEHHAVGTYKDVGATMTANGMSTRGEKSASAVLTEPIVREILAEYDGRRGQLRRLGEKHGVAWQTVADVVHRRTWVHIDV